jgi:hypothetical protein
MSYQERPKTIRPPSQQQVQHKVEISLRHQKPTKAPTKATTKPISKLVVEPTAKQVTTKSTPNPVAKPTAKPATTLNATTKLAATFSVNKTNVSILLTELDNHYQSDCAHLHPEKKLPLTIQKKESTPTKKIKFDKAALTASKAKDLDQGGAELENEPGPCGEYWHMIVKNSSKLIITIILSCWQ